MMKVYKVGGCVRDTLLGLTPKDIDYVVVGATPVEMQAQGFSQVGASFPVFLHPVTGDEYALARTERKVGEGYHGFDVVYDSTVTLEDDLIRRDLTINAMAMDMETGEIIDPHGGRHDLAQGILRHTSEAFAEDPVRVLRTARFAARYGFKIADDTVELMRTVVSELDTVPQERIWAEFEKGLMEDHPAAMFDALTSCGAFECRAMERYAAADVANLRCVSDKHGLVTRFVLTCAGFETPADYADARIPTECALVGYTYNTCAITFTSYFDLTAEQRVTLFDRLRLYTRPELLEACVAVLEFYSHCSAAIADQIRTDLVSARSVDAAALADSCGKDGKKIKQVIFDARVAAVRGTVDT